LQRIDFFEFLILVSHQRSALRIIILSELFFKNFNFNFNHSAMTSLLKNIVKPVVSIHRLSIRSVSHFTYKPDEKCNIEGEKVKINMFTAINQAMDMALAADDSTLLFGEDVAFGGVFRCSLNLKNKYGADRVFNSKN
jgi:Transketolase, pyrimidine binding domain